MRSGDTAGTGLGLSIARDLAIAHDGSLVAANRQGDGAATTPSLPIKTETHVAATKSC